MQYDPQSNIYKINSNPRHPYQSVNIFYLIRVHFSYPVINLA